MVECARTPVPEVVAENWEKLTLPGANEAWQLQTRHEGDHGAGEGLVVVGRRGVCGRRQIHNLGVRREFEQPCNSLRSDDVGLAAVQQQHRHGDGVGGIFELLETPVRIIIWMLHERRIPVPVPTTIGLLA